MRKEVSKDLLTSIFDHFFGFEVFFELLGALGRCWAIFGRILGRVPLNPGFAGGTRVEPGGGDLGELPAVTWGFYRNVFPIIL